MTNSTDIEIKMYEAYDAGYQVFLEKWQVNRQVGIDLMQQNLKPQGTQVAVLSIGSGPGDFDIEVIKSLKQHLADKLSLKYVAVEPNHIHRHRYEQRINNPEFADVEKEIHADKIEDFQTNDKFDVIHYTHCLYHMPGSEKLIVQRGIEMLKDDGFLIITLDTNKAVIFETMFKYAALTGQGFAEMLQMEEMQAIIDEIKLPYKVVHYPEYLDVQLCFEKDSVKGKALMDFFCQADSSLLSYTQREEILNILSSNIKENNGCKMVPLPAATMIIYKNKINN
ncbi:class I SAM-dependent methyltransferase [Calothrix sp. UHCC 0171]|uniref:class I SAM-dependent methyltransferase n=1 Tax=Calothrix sp. UHCC 0171 TaxID=3110245 RepID=UPI002B1EE948|nr:class I SAM-dependent methyltransferase [Calothrix sp. UHCC 0171]MEA5571725.1 class I SAM-dependent methyltransferase [Calothrix sp. UHCC 0171]